MVKQKYCFYSAIKHREPAVKQLLFRKMAAKRGGGRISDMSPKSKICMCYPNDSRMILNRFNFVRLGRFTTMTDEQVEQLTDESIKDILTEIVQDE